MPTFTVTGEFDPFLHVSLKKGEKIYCEQGAMVTMDTTLDLTGQMSGGFMSALTRSFANGESFFQQHVEASRGDGDILLSPTMPGSIELLELGQHQYILNDGAFLASTDGVDIKPRTQNLGQAMMGGTGGFVVMETTGSGKMAISGFGSIFALDVTAGNDVIVDNVHVLAWDSTLNYKISMTTAENQGFLRNLVNSVTSGEGLVNRFTGNGKVYVCSRNKQGFSSWLASLIGMGSPATASRSNAGSGLGGLLGNL